MMTKFMIFLMLVLPVLLSVAFMTLAERKILSLMMIRQGPNKTSIMGILQPLSDAAKLVNKEKNSLSNFSMTMYYLVSLVMLTMSLMLWTTMPSSSESMKWKMSFLVLMAFLGVMAVKSILAGWSTFSKYSLLGGMRTVSQMVSYESIIYLCFLIIIWTSKSFSINDLNVNSIKMMAIISPVLMMMWMPSILAELNRTPYDFSEGESELVSGFNTEFGSSCFTVIFLSEYSNIIFFMTLTSMMLILTSNLDLFLSVSMILNFWVIWIRSTLPRMRFDKFMMKAWKFYIPFTTIVLMFHITFT